MERLTSGSTAAARKCLLITCKIIIPPPDSGDLPDGPPYFTKKMFPPDCWDPPATSSHARKCVRKKTIRPPTVGTHQLHHRTQGSASGQKNDSPPDCWDRPATSSQARKCLTVGTHLVEAYIALSFWSRTCTYILVDVEARTCRSRGGQGARKNIRPRMCTYGRGLEHLLVHTYNQGSCTWLGRNG